MVVKGIISAIYTEEKKLSVILPEYDNMTTAPLRIYGNPNMDDYSVNEFVLVAVFNDDFNDGMVVAETSAVDLDEISITVDDAFDYDSENPVQNKVVTEKITEIETTVGNVEILLKTI